jgi:hypothetical protein
MVQKAADQSQISSKFRQLQPVMHCLLRRTQTPTLATVQEAQGCLVSPAEATTRAFLLLLAAAARVRVATATVCWCLLCLLCMSVSTSLPLLQQNEQEVETPQKHVQFDQVNSPHSHLPDEST